MDTNNNKILEEKIHELELVLKSENPKQFNEKLMELHTWLEKIDGEEKKELFPKVLELLTLLKKTILSKMEMYEEIGLDQTLKREANQQYSQY